MNKTDIRYWKKRVTFPTSASRTYAVQIQFGKRRWVPLYTANKEQAAVIARDAYLDIITNGWDAALARRKGVPAGEKKSDVTIGEYLDAVRAKSLIHTKTIESYGSALRKIASDIHGLSSKARSTWRTQVDAVKLATLTAEMIEAWRANFIKRGSVNPIKEKSARVSANSFIGRARSLFGADVIARVRDFVEIPSPVPFHGVKVEKVRVPRYRSGFDMAALLESARLELAIAHPEAFKVFLLASMVGLRRNEVDKLTWEAFRWDEGVIRIQATEHFRPKSRESENDVMVDPQLIEIFHSFHTQARSEFVIESAAKPDNGKPFEHYRCAGVFAELIAWLRRHGVNSRTPLHALRKEYGSWVNEHFGLFAASAQLRHADIKTTALHYIESKRKPILSFGLLARSEATIIPIDARTA